MIGNIWKAVFLSHNVAYVFFLALTLFLVWSTDSQIAGGSNGLSPVTAISLLLWGVYKLFGWAVIASIVFLKIFTQTKPRLPSKLLLFGLLFIVFQLIVWFWWFGWGGNFITSIVSGRFPGLINVIGLRYPILKEGILAEVFRYFFILLSEIGVFLILLTGWYKRYGLHNPA